MNDYVSPIFILMDFVIRRLLLIQIVIVSCLSPLHAQSQSPAESFARPEAVYTPMPVYKPEWSKQGLTGKGVVLVTIDKQTGKVTGARMLESTGSPLLDGSALQAYSQWRFKPGTVPQLKIPIEFTNRPRPGTPASAPRKPAGILPFLILFGAGVVLMVVMKRRRPN